MKRRGCSHKDFAPQKQSSEETILSPYDRHARPRAPIEKQEKYAQNLQQSDTRISGNGGRNQCSENREGSNRVKEPEVISAILQQDQSSDQRSNRQKQPSCFRPNRAHWEIDASQEEGHDDYRKENPLVEPDRRNQEFDEDKSRKITLICEIPGA